MIRSFTRILALVVLSAVAFSACSKNKEESLAVTKDNLAGTYMITSIIAKQNSDPEQDVTDQYFDEACEIDDEYLLKASGSLDRFDGSTTCSPTNAYTGDTWAIDNKTIVFDDFYGDVIKLTTTQMVLKFTMTVGNQSITVTYYFSKK